MSRGKVKEPSSPGYRRGLLFGYQLSQIAQQVVAQFRKVVDFPLGVDRVLPAQLFRFVLGGRKCVQVPGKASGTREEIGNLSLSCGVEQIQSVCIGFVDREFRQGERAEFVKMFLRAEFHPLKLPNFFEALHAVDYGCDLSNQS
jgi:hypothetical protein